MAKIYVPSQYINKPCYVINNGYIRVYDTINTNIQNNITDIYINQDYMLKKGTASYSTYTLCDDFNTYTNDYVYRVDFANILISSSIMIGGAWFLISKLVKTFFFGRRRL